MDIEERARDGGIEILWPDHRRFAERRNRTRVDRQGHIHRMRRVIDDRSDRLNLGQRPALAAEIVDDPRLRRAQVAGRGGVAGLEADDPGRQLGSWRISTPAALRTRIERSLNSGPGSTLMAIGATARLR